MCRFKPQHAKVVRQSFPSSPDPPDFKTSFAFCNYANIVRQQQTNLQVENQDTSSNLTNIKFAIIKNNAKLLLDI